MKKININKRFSNILESGFNEKHWHNEGEFCNRKTHPISFHYRKYKRGKNRCNYCGAKIGKIKCVMESNKQRLVNDIYTTTPLLKLLKNKLSIKEI